MAEQEKPVVDREEIRRRLAMTPAQRVRLLVEQANKILAEQAAAAAAESDAPPEPEAARESSD